MNRVVGLIYREGGEAQLDMKQIYEENEHVVFGYLMGLTGGNKDLSEELTQETFYRAIKNIHKFRGDAKISTWLCQIAKYVFYQHIDKKKRHKEVSIDTAVEVQVEKQLEQEYVDNEGKLRIYKKIHTLSSPLKDVLMLRLTGDLSFKEIGDILGKSENWARVTYYRGKQMIGRELSNDESSL